MEIMVCLAYIGKTHSHHIKYHPRGPPSYIIQHRVANQSKAKQSKAKQRNAKQNKSRQGQNRAMP